MKILVAILVILLIGLWVKAQFFSFRAQKPTDYAGTLPQASLTRHLAGDLLSEGVIYGPTGKVVSRFTAEMKGTWEGDRGKLTESFTYSSGETQAREWQLTLGENGAFTATADDIIGEGRGQVSGSSIMIEYTIALPETAGGHKLDVKDWLYLTENGVWINRSEMTKFGVKVAELVATIRPKP